MYQYNGIGRFVSWLAGNLAFHSRGIGTKILIPVDIGTNNVTRRHRIEEPELMPLMRAAAYRLDKLVGDGPGDKDIEPLFKVLWRFKMHRPGPPGYPDINLNTINELLREIQDIIYDDYIE